MFLEIAILLIILIILPDIYIYRAYIHRVPAKKSVKMLYFIPTFLLITGLCLFPLLKGAEMSPRQMIYFGWFMVAFFLFVLPKFLFTFIILFGWPFRRVFNCPRLPFTLMGLALSILMAGMILEGAVIGRTNFEVKEVDFHAPDLPASFDGYRIVQLSDIHTGGWVGYEEELQEAIERVNEQEADLIVITGDLINSKADELKGFEAIYKQLRAKDGVYSIMGNHDYGSYAHWSSKEEEQANIDSLQAKEASFGWKMLNNENTIIYHKGDSIALIGVENWGELRFPRRGNLAKAIKGTEEVAFKLLLTHNPKHWREEVIAKTDIELALSGHTHAWQVSVGDYSPAVLMYPEWQGMYSEGNQSLYVNVGLGIVGFPMRIGARPEITVITLRK